MTNESYAKAGVNLETAQNITDTIKSLAAPTLNENTLGGVGFFGAMYELQNYKNPIICTCNALKTTKFSAMIKQSLVIRLDKCMKKNCLHFIDKISSKEGLKISEKDKNRIYKQTYGDYRQILFQLYNEVSDS